MQFDNPTDILFELENFGIGGVEEEESKLKNTWQANQQNENSSHDYNFYNPPQFDNKNPQMNTLPPSSSLLSFQTDPRFLNQNFNSRNNFQPNTQNPTFPTQDGNLYGHFAKVPFSNQQEMQIREVGQIDQKEAQIHFQNKQTLPPFNNFNPRFYSDPQLDPNFAQIPQKSTLNSQVVKSEENGNELKRKVRKVGEPISSERKGMNTRMEVARMEEKTPQRLEIEKKVSLMINQIQQAKAKNEKEGESLKSALKQFHTILSSLSPLSTTQQQQQQDLVLRRFEELKSLERRLKELIETSEQQKKLLVSLLNKTILETKETSRVVSFIEELSPFFTLLDLFSTDVNKFKASPLFSNLFSKESNPPSSLKKSQNNPLAFLVFRKQPFPAVFSKNKQIPKDSLCVELLTCPSLSYKVCGPVKVELLIDVSSLRGKKPKKLVDNEVENLKEDLTSTFSLKFNTGSRKQICHVKAKLEIQAGEVKGIVESMPSRATVLITNECQWEGSAGCLLKESIFEKKEEVSWIRFLNFLQFYFVKWTKQDSLVPTRPLSSHDFDFFHQKYFASSNKIKKEQFDKFWDWFGKCLQVIRYQRHIGSLWQNGILNAFITKEEVNEALKNLNSGAFIIRFSERHSGQFAIAYVGADLPLRVKHYLVKPTDTASAKKTLPDFICECAQFSELLKFTVDPQTKNATYQKYPKADLLSPFITNRDDQDPGEGYEPLNGK